MKVVGIMQVGGRAPWLKYSLPNLRSLVDDAILLARGGIAEASIPDLQGMRYYDFRGNEWDGLNYAIRLAGRLNPDWLFFMDSDEVLVGTRQTLEDLSKKDSLHIFKRIWLWMDEFHYRVDFPEKFQSFTQYTCFIPYNGRLKMERPYPFWLRLSWGRKIFDYPRVERHAEIIVKHYAALDKDYKKKQLMYMVDILKHNPFEEGKKLVERFMPHFEEPVLEQVPREWS